MKQNRHKIRYLVRKEYKELVPSMHENFARLFSGALAFQIGASGSGESTATERLYEMNSEPQL